MSELEATPPTPISSASLDVVPDDNILRADNNEMPVKSAEDILPSNLQDVTPSPEKSEEKNTNDCCCIAKDKCDTPEKEAGVNNVDTSEKEGEVNKAEDQSSTTVAKRQESPESQQDEHEISNPKRVKSE